MLKRTKKGRQVEKPIYEKSTFFQRYGINIKVK